MRFPSSCSERGTVTAEIAMGIPAVLGIIGLGFGALRWGADQVTATTVAAESSLAIARGADPGSAMSLARDALPSARWEVSMDSGRVCVTASMPAPLVLLESHRVRQCASS